MSEPRPTSVLNLLVVHIIRAYQDGLRPHFRSRQCRFDPTCSDYALEAFTTFGTIRAARLTIDRLRRCNPEHQAGVDPVPLAPQES